MKNKFALCLLAFGLIGCSTISNNGENINKVSEYKAPEISVQTIGKGKDIVLIPGLGSPPQVYDALVEHLKPNYRVHMVHLAGYAGLPLDKNDGGIFDPAASAIAKYLKDKKLEGVTLIGHSMGGELSMAINARNPNLVSKILVVDAFTYYSLLLNPAATPENMAPNAAGLRAMFKAMPDDKYKQQQIVSIARLVKAQDKRDMVLDWSLKSNRHAIAQGLYDLMTIDLRPELKNNKAKIQLIYAHDNAMGLPQAVVDGLYQNAYKDIPNATTKRIDNSLHFIMYDQPDAFLKEVDEFLR